MQARLVHLAQLAVGHGQRIVDAAGLGLQLQCLFIMVDGLFKVASSSRNLTQPHPCRRRCRVQLQGLLKTLLCRLGATLVQLRPGQAQPSRQIVRLQGQGLLVVGAGFL